MDVGNRSPIAAFDLKLRRTKQALKLWSKNHVGDIQKQLGVVSELRACLVDRPISDFPTSAEILLFGRPVFSPGHCPTQPEKAS
jgi:hypothetical protein